MGLLRFPHIPPLTHLMPSWTWTTTTRGTVKKKFPRSPVQPPAGYRIRQSNETTATSTVGTEELTSAQQMPHVLEKLQAAALELEHDHVKL